MQQFENYVEGIINGIRGFEKDVEGITWQATV
jgi:hypothetical protein